MFNVEILYSLLGRMKPVNEFHRVPIDFNNIISSSTGSRGYHHHNIIDAIPCVCVCVCVCVSARNFIIKIELFNSKVIWPRVTFAGYCDSKI